MGGVEQGAGSTPQGVTFYRKKPVVVEARRVQTHNLAEIAEWCGGVAYTDETPWDHSAGAVVMPDGHYAHVGYRDWGVIVPTLEGDMLARFGWWIVKGVKGEFYPIESSIFRETYEPAPIPLVMPADEFALTKQLWDDLRTVLAEYEAWDGGKDNEAFARLAAAAGVQ